MYNDFNNLIACVGWDFVSGGLNHKGKMDYASEQQMELEALEAIFMDELQVYDGDTPNSWPAVGQTYKIVVTPQEDGEDGLAGADELEMELLFAHTAHYPEEAPCLKLRSSVGLSDADIERCSKMLQQQVTFGAPKQNWTQVCMRAHSCATVHQLRKRTCTSNLAEVSLLGPDSTVA